MVLQKKLVEQGFEVTLLNRGTKNHDLNLKEIHVDRKDKVALKNALINEDFSYVVDVSGLNRIDLENSYEALKHMNLKNYIFISSSAVYEPSEMQPISEEFPIGENPFWGQYGIDKIEAENFLREKYHDEGFNFVGLRPPYIYGEGNYVYREAHVFDRVNLGRPIIVPKGNTIVQFYHIDDLANMVYKLLVDKDSYGNIYNVGDSYGITFKEWVKKCIMATGKEAEILEFDYKNSDYNLRDFFPYHDYQYILDTKKIEDICKTKVILETGLQKAYEWYIKNEDKVIKKPQLLINENKILEILKTEKNS